MSTVNQQVEKTPPFTDRREWYTVYETISLYFYARIPIKTELGVTIEIEKRPLFIEGEIELCRRELNLHTRRLYNRAFTPRDCGIAELHKSLKWVFSTTH